MTHRDERGVSESVQWSLVIPLVLVVLVAAVQGALWLRARQAAQHAAAAAAEVEAGHGATAGSGRDAALRLTDRAQLRDVSVRVDGDAREVRVWVTGRSVQLLPLFDTAVSEWAAAPRERVTS